MDDATIRNHMKQAAAFETETRGIHAQIFEKIDGLATKEDIQDLKEFMRAMQTGIGFFKFTWDNASKIGSFLLLIGGVFVFFKVGLAAGVAWIFGSK